MSKATKFLSILLCWSLGISFLTAGIKEYRNSKRLAAEGKLTTGAVVDRDIVSRRRAPDRYYLVVKFQTEMKQECSERVRVSSSQYWQASIGETVKVRYLPADPAICAVSEKVNTPLENLLFGASFMRLLLGGMLVLAPLIMKWTARTIVKQTRVLTTPEHEHVPVDAREFRHLDLAWYDAARQRMEAREFVFLQDEENLNVTRSSHGNRTLLRVSLSREGTTMACLYHFKPGWTLRLLGAKATKVLDLETQFSNGAWVCTSGAQDAGKLNSPPGIDALYLPPTTPLETLIESHQQRLTRFLAQNPRVQPVRMHGIDDIHRAQSAQQQIKAAYRREHGLSREELQRIAGPDAGEGLDEIHAEVSRLQEQQKRKAA